MNVTTLWSGISTAGSVISFFFPGQATDSKVLDPKVLDPISTIIKMALLALLEDKTKLEIKENQIVFQKPSDYYFGEKGQWLDRRWKRLRPDEYQTIQFAIFKATEWYFPKLPPKPDAAPAAFVKFGPKDPYTIGLKELSPLQKIFWASGRGLAGQFTKTYIDDSPTCVSMIQLWLERIEKGFNEGIPPCEDESTSLSKRIKALWTEGEINNISNILATALEKQGDTDPNKEFKCKGEFDGIEGLLKDKAKKFVEILQEEHAKAMKY